MKARELSGTEQRDTYGVACAVSVAVFSLYLATLAPGTAMWDASEYITAAYTLGIPHPPGNPLFLLLGRVSSLVPISTVAVRINALAAFSSAIACGVWFLVRERVLRGCIEHRGMRLLAACIGALLSATAFTVWNQSVVNEKVYTVSLAFFAIVSWLTIRWSNDPDARGADRLLVLIAFLIALGYTNHPAGFLVAPAVAVAVIVRRPRVVLRIRLMISLAVAFAIGLTPFAVEPIRAAWHPVLNEGDVTGCTEHIGLSCTFSHTTNERLFAHINREQYGKPDLSQRQAPFSGQIGMWWLYFKWQWLRDAHGEAPVTQLALALLFLALGVLGGWTHWRFDRESFWFFASLVFTVTLALVYYMNFKYGASQDPLLRDVPREVRDRDYFYLWSYSTWSVWAALGLASAWRWTAARMDVGSPRWLAASPVLLIGCIPLVLNWHDASRAGETATGAWAHDLLNSVEPYGVLVTLGDNDTFPLWYAQEVEHVRPDVTVAVTSLLGTDWYPRNLLRRPVSVYDAARGPEVYRTRTYPLPDKPLFSLTTAQLDAIPQYVDIHTPVNFQQGDIHAIVDPRRLEYGVPTRGDLLVLQLIKDNIGVRPVYIARTSGSYVQALGLDAYSLMQGLAYKISTSPVVATPDTLPVDGGGFVDLTRSFALWKQFEAPSAIVRRNDWIDRPSVGIPILYAVTASVLAEIAQRRGDARLSERLTTQAVDIASATRMTELFSSRARQAPQQPASDSAAERQLQSH